ncbi:hypothetical protein CYY_009190 [Polysphondylium violaceum]|uniref:Uncharacterized protein n=1 Tax=Polysphondylium violaceum TaxID=133409 RepID=A0A8J4PKK2_9MYCE|nr:hypothetical protein CYY_009190 [Polysphondylium violaceum]
MALKIRKEFVVVMAFILMAVTIYLLESSRISSSTINNNNNNNNEPSVLTPKPSKHNTPTPTYTSSPTPHNTHTPTYTSSPTPYNSHTPKHSNTPSHSPSTSPFNSPTPSTSEINKYYDREETGYNNSITRSQFAYTFYITNDNYLCAALISAHQIRQWTQNDIVVHLVIGGQYSAHMLGGFKSLNNVYFRYVDNVLPPNGGAGSAWQQTWNKFWCFKLTQYRRVIHLDADTYILKDLDHLFLLPEADLAMPRAYWLNNQPFATSLLMVLTPSDELYKSIIENGHGGNDWDMDILNRMYRHSPHFIMLPGIYGLLHGEFASNQTPWLSKDREGTWEKAPLFHWSTWKPWNIHEGSPEVGNYGSNFKKTWTLWNDGRKNYCSATHT